MFDLCPAVPDTSCFKNALKSDQLASTDSTVFQYKNHSFELRLQILSSVNLEQALITA